MFGRYALVFSILLSASYSYASKSAEVIIEGAIVYKQPDFDAPVLGYFNQGKKIRISNKTIGPFYKVRFKQGVNGYISDVDIHTEGQTEADNRQYEDQKKALLKQNRPFLGTHYLGLSYGMVQYRDTISSYSGSSNVPSVGVAYSGPLSIFDGVFSISANVLYSLAPPDLYEKISLQKPSGYLLTADVLLNYPLMDFAGKKGGLILAAGPMLSYSDVEVVQTVNSSNLKIPLQSARIGVAFSLALSYQLSKNWAVKIDPKYYIEQEKYLAVAASLLYEL